MKKILKISILALIVLLSTTTFSLAQDTTSNKIINSYDVEIQYGMGAGILGVTGKINHWWIENNNFKLQSGLQLGTYNMPEGFVTENQTITGFMSDIHLQFHTGIEQSFFKKQRIYLFAEMYAGVYNVYTNGSFKQPELNIDRKYTNNEFLADYGSRFGFGYRVKEKWGIHLSISNSWRRIDSGIGAVAALLSGVPDGKMTIGIGLNYRLD
jgi:hypothetical protein